MGCAPSSPVETAAPPPAKATVKALAAPKVHLFALSQPSRSVQILLEAGGVEFETVQVALMAGEKCKPNPTGSVPYIEDAATGVSMGEGLAILVHLCETRPALSGYYPADPKTRATINYWLHWHHTGSRTSTMFFRALFMSDDVALHEKELYKVLPQFLFMEQALSRQGTPYFAGDALTIADLALVTEVDQLDACLDVLFGDGLFPLLEAWRARVGQLPAYANNPGLQMLKGMAPMMAPKVAALKDAVGPKIADAVKALTATASSAADAVAPSAVDANNDGKITPAEVGAYLARLDAEDSEGTRQKL